MKITKRKLRGIINEYHPRPDDDYDPLDPDDDEDDAAYDQGYDDGFNGYPSKPVIGGDYHAGYEEGVNDAKDEESRAEYDEEFGMRREGVVKITKHQLSKIIKEETWQLTEAGQMIGEPTTTLNPESGKWEAQDETSRTLKISAENAAAVEKAKSVIEQQLNNLYHDQMLENTDLVAILEQMIKDINSGFVGEPT